MPAAPGDVPSPVTGGATSLIETVASSRIAQAYRVGFGVDVRDFLPRHDLDLRLCEDTGYRFFHPAEAEGPPEFYERLYSMPESDWSYGDGKWEYNFARQWLSPETSLLDCGCGGGEFLDLVRNDIALLRGLETNEYGRERCLGKGLDVLGSDIRDYAQTVDEGHDVVTIFQVLEHIYDVRGFIRACSATLKPGGRLIVAVPNNDSFIKLIPDLPTNMPPHHVGRWTRGSLTSLQDHFDLTLEWIEEEPLHERNIGAMSSAFAATYLPRSRVVRSLYYRLGLDAAFRRFLAENRASIRGHCIAAVFRKDGGNA